MMKRLSYQTMAECDCDSSVCMTRGYCMAERIKQLENGGDSSIQSVWRSIETAPRDGKTIVDLHDGYERRTNMVWEMTSPMNPNGCWKKEYQSWNEADAFEATHWMPIPPKPE